MRTREGHIVLFGSRRPLDAFAGVPEILREHGVEVCYERLWDRELRFGQHALPELIRGARAIAFADLSYNAHLAPTRVARAMKVPTVLLVDGVVEYANTFQNPWLGSSHLQNTPHDAVLAMGPLQGKILTDLGNRVTVTGLPRLDGFEDRIAHARSRIEANQWLVIATANTPAMDGDGLERVRAMLLELREEASSRNLAVRWRIDASLANDLGVAVDAAPLLDSLAGARATITTASTLAVESMLAGVPTAIAHPHPHPLWVPAAWVWRRSAGDSTIDDLPVERLATSGETLDALLSNPKLDRQDRILEDISTQNAADRVARALLDVRWTGNTNSIPSMGRAATNPSACETLYVAVCDHESARPAIVDRAMEDIAADPLSHVLCIGLSPLNFADTRTPSLDHDRAHEVVPDPTLSTHERAQAVLDAALALKPSRVSFDDDRVLALAAQLVARGVRCDDPRLTIRNDHAVRSIERWPWAPQSPDEEAAADAWLEHELRASGYEHIAFDGPTEDCDAVLVRAGSLRPHPAHIDQWRDRGLGVALSPNMYVEHGVYAVERAIARLVARGCSRIAVALWPGRSPVLIAPIRHGAPIVGFLDDAAHAFDTHLGLPAHPFIEGIDALRPDALIALHESDLARCKNTGLPTELVDLEEARAHEVDHALREAVHGESLAHPRVDRG
ncbi:MAG: hypothetical protein ACIAQU_11880 [Phycisphaerales bacterium JB064]